jgi:hypothetical protein
LIAQKKGTSSYANPSGALAVTAWASIIDRTVGEGPGRLVSDDPSNAPPGAVGGRGEVVIPFHGHMLSFRAWPILFGEGVA